MSHLPRVPVRFIEANSEMLESLNKSNDAGQRIGATDNRVTEGASSVFIEQTYRCPPDRVHGNTLFRRNPDGFLDYDYACQQIVGAIHKVRDGIPPTSLEQAALSCCFPGVFSYIDSSVVSSVRAVNLKMTPEESMTVASKVASHLAKEVEFMLSSHAR